MVRSFGAGLITWPHGINVDHEGNVWVADGVGYRAVPEGVGHTVRKFSPEGELLLTLGRPGQPGDGEQTLRKPSDVLVAPNGNIFVVDSHDASERPVLNSRVVKYDPEGRYITSWGSFGSEAGEFRYPHALAMDSEGRLFVGDRYNNRIQIFTQEGEHIATWTQFGRPSGIYIDENDTIYVADSESNTRRNPGFKRGIRVGSAKTGFVSAFIPDPIEDQDESGGSGAEGVTVDAAGNIYGAQVSPPGLWRYEPK
jgi:sugar lactone lactonase YvrE